MKTGKHMAALVLALMALVALSACETDRTEGVAGTEQVAVDDYESIDLNLPFGGLTPTDEEEAFGDPELQLEATLDEGEDADDMFADSPEVQALEELGAEPGDGSDQPRPRFTFLRVAWGRLEVERDGNEEIGPQEPVEMVDWTGQLWVDRGIAIVRRLLRFEPGDQIVRVPGDPRTVAWFSTTGRHFDGLLVEVIERPEEVDLPDEPNVLHFQTGPYSGEYVIDDLPGLDEIHPVSPEPNAIHFTGFRLNQLDICPKGFMAGMWRADTDSSGHFRGRFGGLFGHIEGYFRGAWGYNDARERVFTGKFIDLHGRFRGLLAGTWEPSADIPGGVIQGGWFNAAQTREGVLRARYFQIHQRRGGFLQGRWAELCDEEATDALR